MRLGRILLPGTGSRVFDTQRVDRMVGLGRPDCQPTQNEIEMPVRNAARPGFSESMGAACQPLDLIWWEPTDTDFH